MADQLYLSYWLRGFSEHNMLRHFDKMLRLFPFSRQARSVPVLKVHAIEFAEPPLLERGFESPLEPGEVIQASQEFQHADCVYQLEAWWDLWQFEAQWKLIPSPVVLFCFGPAFESELGEHLRIDFGLDAHYLPQPGAPDSARRVRSNIQGLLRLVHELDGALAVGRRQLWTESGENFAERLQAALEAG